ncbi:uncharacterized protein LOC108163923 isoform X2 [Drosophila miranda]|uniref:uncharacterized protein LOC108163923 isoform X2 n=1 Tax=Drosophila miranda TaxID=7229 RepID=UPI0007E7C7C5|nr:uncharacterized protein LOC108163923 isoform X2 [Drosophila miranda]
MLRFLFDGQYIGDTETPSDLGMEEGDKIELYMTQGDPVVSEFIKKQFNKFLFKKCRPFNSLGMQILI